MYKLYNGDCLEVMDKLIEEGVKVDCVLTDIPYGEVNRSKESGLRKLGKGKADEITFDINELLLRL